MKIILSNRLLIENAPSDLKDTLKERLTFPNPKWTENEKRGYWNGATPKYIRGYEEIDGSLIIPRGFINQLIVVCRDEGIDYRIENNRRTLPPVDFSFQGTLKTFQEKAVEDILSSDFGTLSVPTGSGKTVIALYMIADRKQPVLVIVHNKGLMTQWRDRTIEFLGIPDDEIGLIGDGNKTIGDRLTIGISNSVYKVAEDLRDHIGFLGFAEK